MNLLITSADQRPDLVPLLSQTNPWPTFMCQDPIGPLYYTNHSTTYPEFTLIAIDQDRPGHLMAKGLTVPFTWDHDPTESLPPGGWDVNIHGGCGS